MGIIESILIFIAVVLILVVSHELGHFSMSKFFGVRVDEFGVGIPPRIFGIKKGETLYSLNLLPLGGFVKIFGEEQDIEDPRSFSAKGFWQKTLIVAAGVIANIIVAFLLFSFIAWFGTPVFHVRLGEIVESSPAMQAGLKTGDLIVRVDGNEQPARTAEEFRIYIDEHRGAAVDLSVMRGGEEKIISVVPRVSPPEGQGPLGVSLEFIETGIQKAPWYKAPLEGLRLTLDGLSQVIYGLVYFFGELFSKGQTPGEVVGPVGIAVIAKDTFQAGLRYFVTLLAFLSLNLAVINVLPIPALDGGRILFFVIEKIIRRPIPTHIANMIHSIFFLLLIGFLLWVSYSDIARIRSL